ncbi:2-oxoacid:ferredoxin oxidoreductase subunit beta [Serinicoccus chungangensis]|uniref:2-oxoacid:ferredoxin oxidoreductase subunit beta n=1 Tax=Serinicoccus chungangensis TaxID=767452 RepID=A0A0W8IAH3_9MICO|nr:2-oxoacid:ferredoxin oxidoreductase subunit beta [Serinicoccus chungangensis]KUG56816.1 2-oxoacid:ferredoxin oxidoreductase subunit beta [Serinicoccus chungangensis]
MTTHRGSAPVTPRNSTTELGLPARRGTAGVPTLPEGEKQTKKDFTSDQEVRWCPGCGDYAVLAAVQGFLPDLGLRRENIVFVSGIGCSSRFPYYLDTYGMHSIHGRAPAIATGLATSREDLSVWVVTGDGDALSIGGNHLIHAMRRNVNLTILLFNNKIYGLTKGQYSPTSDVGAVTKSTPSGSVDHPFNPVSLALGSEATFVARTMDSDRAHLTEVLKAAAAHRGTSLVEIYQNCPIFNDGAFQLLKDRDEATGRVAHLRAHEPVRIGAEGSPEAKVVVRDPEGRLHVVPEQDVPQGHTVVVHDPADPDPTSAFGLSRLDDPSMQTVPMGIFRQVERPTYDDGVREQVRQATAGTVRDTASLDALLHGRDTWTVDGTRPGQVEQLLEGETTEGPTPAAGEALVEEGEEVYEDEGTP